MCTVFVCILGIMETVYTILCYLNMKGYVTNILCFMYICIPFVIMYTICSGSAQLQYFAVHMCMACVTACELSSAAAHAGHQNNLGHVNPSHVHKHSDG